MMNKNKIDLRALPTWLKYVISLTVIIPVMGAAWIVGRDEPVPGWLQHRLIPILGWIYIGCCLYLIIYHLARRLAKRRR